MLMEFKTKRDINGNYKFLAIDTGAEIYTRFNPHFISDGVEVKAHDYNFLLEQVKNWNFVEMLIFNCFTCLQ